MKLVPRNPRPSEVPKGKQFEALSAQDEHQMENTEEDLETVKILHRTVVSLRSALERSKTELHDLREKVKNTVDPEPLNRTIENLAIENHVLRERVLSAERPINIMESNKEETDGSSDADDVFEPEVNGTKPRVDEAETDQATQSQDETSAPRISKGDSEESEEVDDIELIFTTDDTKELTLSEDLVPIGDTEPSCRTVRAYSRASVFVETDISKCGIIDENEPPAGPRRNTLATTIPYRPIIQKETVSNSRPQLNSDGSAKTYVKFSPQTKTHPRPILAEKNTSRLQESEAQTDITALPSHWRSESFLAHGKVAHQFTTLPSKFTLPFGQLRKQSLRLSEKTQEARRVLLSDINFTSMVPELSRSADHLCQEVNGNVPAGQSLLSKYPRAFSYMKNPELMRSTNGGWSPCDCHRRPSWSDCYGSPPASRRRHSLRPSLSSLDASWMGTGGSGGTFGFGRPVWASVPSSPTHYHRSRSVPLSCSYTPRSSHNSDVTVCQSANYARPCRTTTKTQTRPKVKFQDSHLGSYPGRSLPDLRSDGGESAGEDSTDSLIEESEHFLRRSIDSMLAGGDDLSYMNSYRPQIRRPRSHSQPNHGISNGWAPPRKSQPFIARSPSNLRHDQWVKVITGDGRLTVGRVRYVGPLPGQSDVHVGIILPQHAGGNTNGTYAGARYFDCDADCGLFVPFKKVVMAWSL